MRYMSILFASSSKRFGWFRQQRRARGNGSELGCGGELVCFFKKYFHVGRVLDVKNAFQALM